MGRVGSRLGTDGNGDRGRAVLEAHNFLSHYLIQRPLCNLKHTHQFDKQKTMKPKPKILKQWAVALCVAFIVTASQAQDKKPNILFIMGDDIGWMQPSCYHRGLMIGETPNIDPLANEGAI